MLGLRTREENNFILFFEMVQKEAKKRDCVFFLDCGLGKVFKTSRIECEDICGWLIPKEYAKEFEYLFVNNLESVHDFDDYYTNVDYNVKGDTINIIIDDV